jgi:ketosteroid isomerase-like protein
MLSFGAMSDDLAAVREILRRWLAAINDHDVGTLVALMAPAFVFVDSLGNQVQGAAKMAAGWQAYFAMCPNFWVRADHVSGDGPTLLLVGEAGGTIDGEAWRIPSAWSAVVRHGKIWEWRVFADNKPVYEILARRAGQA